MAPLPVTTPTDMLGRKTPLHSLSICGTQLALKKITGSQAAVLN